MLSILMILLIMQKYKCATSYQKFSGHDSQLCQYNIIEYNAVTKKNITCSIAFQQLIDHDSFDKHSSTAYQNVHFGGISDYRKLEGSVVIKDLIAKAKMS